MATSGSVSTGKYDGRYYTVSWTATQSVANNKSTVSWVLKAVGGNSSWYAERTLKVNITSDNTISGVTSYSKTDRVERYTGTIKSGTFYVTHDNNGDASFNISVQAAVYVSTVNCTGSKDFTLTNIPRKSTLSVANGTLGTAQTLTITRQSTSFTHTIVATCGSASTTICTKSSSTSINFTPPISWASQNTTGTSVSVKYTITTYNGSASVGSNAYTKTCTIPSSVKPSCSVAVTDSMGYADIYGGYIQSKSKFKVVVTPTISYGSAIASYSTTANGATYTSASFTTGVLASSGTLTVNATVKDKRGRTGTASKSLTVLEYSAPKISAFKVKRGNLVDNDGIETFVENIKGDHAKIIFSASVTSLNDINSAVYRVEIKKSTESEYVSYDLDDYANIYDVTDGTYIFEADTGSSYDVRLLVSDNFNADDPTIKITAVSTAFSLIHWLKNGLGIAFGKIAELSNVFDIGFQTRFSGGILHPVLEPNTDLNDVLTPNTYVGANLSTYNYLNCPLDSGTFSLEVVGMGEEGQIKQKLTYCHKTASRTWERIYYQSAWGDWVCVSDFGGQLLWSGTGLYMTDTQTVTLSELISEQPTGIVLVFQLYVPSESATKASDFNTFFVPKGSVADNNGRGRGFFCSTSNLNYIALKYIYIYDDKLVGYVNNTATGTAESGITYNNNRFVLTKVYGV